LFAHKKFRIIQVINYFFLIFGLTSCLIPLNFSTSEDIQNPTLNALKNTATRINKIPAISNLIETGNAVEKKIPKNWKTIPSE
jgi:hypothetical protein